MHYDVLMRTTVTLPADLHEALATIAHDRRQTVSQTLAELLRQSLMPTERLRLDTDPRTGLPVVHVGRPVTAEDVRSLEDEE